MKKREDLKGLYSALIVPFDSEGNVNEEGLRQVVQHNIEEMKVDGLYVGGSTGENFLIDKETKKLIFDVVIDEVNNKIKLIAQIGTPNIYDAIELGNYATEKGYDAISAVTPFYYKFTIEEVKQYYFDIVDNVNNDLIVYSIPTLTGVSISLEEFGELFKHKSIVGVKFTQADFYLLERLRNTYTDILIFSGFDEMLLPAAIYEVDGAIGSTYNVNGIRARKIVENVKDGNLAESRRLQKETNDLISAIQSVGLYPAIKHLLQIQGCDAGEFKSRKPMESITKKQEAEVKKIYDNYLK